MPTTTIPEFLITDTFTSNAVNTNNVDTFTLTLASTQWLSNPGITVNVQIERSADNGQTWTGLAGLTAESGPLPAAPRNVMPSVSVTMTNAGKKSPRLRVVATVSSPLRLGATITYN